MWSDNETTIDLLGFDALADELEVLLTDKSLLPLTVLVDGDWGSGKSSLMKVMKERLESDHSEGDFIVVEFSPWRFEDFEFAKVALMAAVVDAIGDYIGDVEDKQVRESLLKKLNKVRLVLGKFGVFKAAAVVGMAHFGAAAPLLALGSAVADVVGNVEVTPRGPPRKPARRKTRVRSASSSRYRTSTLSSRSSLMVSETSSGRSWFSLMTWTGAPTPRPLSRCSRRCDSSFTRRRRPMWSGLSPRALRGL